MITLEDLKVGSSYLHIQYISGEYGSSSYTEVIESRSQDKNVEKSYYRNVKLRSVITLFYKP